MQNQKQIKDDTLTLALDSFRLSIDRLPSDIARYYFCLMYIAFRDRVKTKNAQEKEVLINAIRLSKKITDNISIFKALSDHGNTEDSTIFSILNDIEALFRLINANAFLKILSEYITNVLGFFIGLVFGLILGVIGLLIGSISRFNIIKGAYDGFLTGALVE